MRECKCVVVYGHTPTHAHTDTRKEPRMLAWTYNGPLSLERAHTQQHTHIHTHSLSLKSFLSQERERGRESERASEGARYRQFSRRTTAKHNINNIYIYIIYYSYASFRHLLYHQLSRRTTAIYNIQYIYICICILYIYI